MKKYVKNLGLETDTHVFFYGGVLSNWWMCNYRAWGMDLNCGEQGMMFGKAIVMRDYKSAAKITKLKYPRDQKKCGREIKNFDQKLWDRDKIDIMTYVLLEKFKQNPDLLEILLSTGDKILVEASPDDTIWGIGLGIEDAYNTPESQWLGQNLLGECLMNVRDKFNAFVPL